MSVISVSDRMTRHFCVQVWRMKLVLSVAVLLFTGSDTQGMSTADGIEFRGISGNQKQFSGGASQLGSRHRTRMLFPLLLSISSRLAKIVPMALIATVAIFLMALFAKKALLVSLATLGLVIYEKFKKKSHIYHYHVTPSHKNYVNDKYYVTEDPNKYAVYSDPYHSSHRQKQNSGYLNDKYYVTEDPHKYAVYSDPYHSSHRQKQNSGYQPYDDDSDFILQQISAETPNW